MRHLAAMVLVSGVLLSACASVGSGDRVAMHTRGAAAADFARVKDSPVALRMFLQRFPKGGDLHNHLSGAVYAEDFIAWALEDDLCLDLEAMAATAAPCDPGAGRPRLADALDERATTRDALIDAWSMRNFVPGYSSASGHQQFFQSFSQFGAAKRDEEMLALAVEQAADQNIVYLELMVSPGMREARRLARELSTTGDFNSQYDALLAAGIENLVPLVSERLDAMEEASRSYSGCPAAEDPACHVEIRYLAQITRTVPPEEVFAQALLAQLAYESEARLVGLNLVAPEDDPAALDGYDAQMEALAFLAERRGGVPGGAIPVSLHAGELTLGLVHPRYLRDHIRKAVEIAGAQRIGHGVDIAYERDAERLLLAMAAGPVAVEINLSSNDLILGVEGERHPFDVYREYGVPLTLSTDDQGISRSDLTHEYQRAVESYDLDYDDVVALSRNSLTYAFLEGDSLWQDPRRQLPVSVCSDSLAGAGAPSEGCAGFLAANRKAALQWRLEEALAAFDADRAALQQERARRDH